MNPNLNIINAHLPGYQERQTLVIREGQIQAILPTQDQHTRDQPILDVQGDWISLAGIDLQINGALGLAFPEITSADEEKLNQICQLLWQQGVSYFLPTLVTTSIENIHRSLKVLSQFSPSKNAAKPLGIHLEGPCLNQEKRGAHPWEYLLPLTLENIKQVLGDYAEVVKVITLAPELDPTGEVISYLTSLGITVSLGHSQATLEQAKLAFAQGATMVTHAFNAMPSLHHRDPGLLGAALVNPKIYCGLIADGIHVCPTMIDLVLRANYKNIFLVSDALAPLGLPDGIYPWDSRNIEVKQGTARLLDGTLSGTTLPLFAGVENLVRWGVCELGEAIELATEIPRKALGMPGISVGQPADLLRWSWNELEQRLTWERLETRFLEETGFLATDNCYSGLI
ncbi:MULTISPECIES: N-acetylglucosamine-6-phosphate deacetylase [unclassified Roseofilum]|uniref:N-acetylglucosamine-6-phosphate deacetylase n=1 Tax=unclassified Roseofilum TaxID=2620099 RepID=UPI001B2D8893|nr:MULTISPECIES: N-acetylglucosamine-6-phosphate deacetylase [unclassified Roseofilum]MBP0007888.1 N-acetylglucosamine-6-phosphate deacetylase [Roseofilum sp. Belize Diploria]MBP0033184.1 N-acetylglucosamine-6-phosphate deacetylase [Roseofilum sp. Belize BBD 4]